jgi:CBS domain-containing protein
MSPRAAWRLEALGFAEIHDYVDGKLDWLAAGLPTEGTNAERPRAADVARTDAPTCRLDEQVERVRERVRAADWDACVVVNDERVVLGLLRQEELERPEGRIEQVMRPGPSTFRPDVPIEEMADFMVAHDLPTSPITSLDGRLIGVLRREDAVHVAHQQHASARRSDEAARHDPRLGGGEPRGSAPSLSTRHFLRPSR